MVTVVWLPTVAGLLHAAGVDGATRVDAKRHLLQRLEELGGSSHRAKREARRLSVRDLLGAGPETELEVSARSMCSHNSLSC